MGSSADDIDAHVKPRHRVTLDAFYIDETEVSVAAYETCVTAGTCRAPREGGLCNANAPDRENHPINCVDWMQATAYCKWLGRRLPSEAEWEYAARGTDERQSPWGNEPPDSTRLNACGGECAETTRLYDAQDGWPATAPVGTFKGGASPFGVLDIAGNVWEWTADWFGNYPAEPATNPHGPETGAARVFRGGGWGSHDAASVSATFRRAGKPTDSDDSLGFRCALDNRSSATEVAQSTPATTIAPAEQVERSCNPAHLPSAAFGCDEDFLKAISKTPFTAQIHVGPRPNFATYQDDTSMELVAIEATGAGGVTVSSELIRYPSTHAVMDAVLVIQIPTNDTTNDTKTTTMKTTSLWATGKFIQIIADQQLSTDAFVWVTTEAIQAENEQSKRFGSVTVTVSVGADDEQGVVIIGLNHKSPP